MVAVSLAIGGVMIFAKTRVEPPVATKSINQFSKKLDDCCATLKKADASAQRDSILTTTISKIKIYVAEEKLEAQSGDKSIDKVLAIYVPPFLKQSFDKFQQSVWNESDHKYMLSVVSNLRSIKYTNKSSALRWQTADSLSIIESVVAKYNKARALSRSTGFYGVESAKSTINQARQYAEDKYLSNCSDLVAALNNVKPSIAQSHYNYISGQVDLLSHYSNYTMDYYHNVLVSQVEEALHEYQDNAEEIYGSGRDISDLWQRARDYYYEASDYYYD